jgi:uncharacterized protein (DUF1800 family)
MTYNKTDVDFALSMSLGDFVENHLLKTLPEPTAPADWADAIPETLNGPHNDVYLEELKIWYLKLLHNHSYSVQERMMLFLHNHFTTEARKTFQIQRIYQQSKLLRSYVFGDFKQLTKEITIDAAMLVYLDGATNTKDSVNENYSRELLELFTIGIGNYSQEDIKQGALALTGWKVPDNSLSSAFDPKYYHGGKITYLGKTGTFGYSEIVDTIFEKPATANFICNKLCLEFISPKPEPSFVEELAQIFIENDYQLRPVLAHMFLSPYFFHEDNKSTKIKNPVEFVLSTLHLFHMEVKNFSTLKHFLLRQDQELFNPPDVKGWRGQRKWINSTTYAIRNAFVHMLLYGKDLSEKNYEPVVDVIAFANSFESHNDATRFIEDLCGYIYHYPVSVERKAFLLDFLTEGNAPSYWTINAENAADKLRKCIHSALTFPEFQLH